MSSNINSDWEFKIGGKYRIGQHLEIDGNLWEIWSKKWMIIFWQSVRMSWKSVDLRRKYTQRTQDREKCPAIGPRLVITLLFLL